MPEKSSEKMETLCRLCGKVNINSINVLDGRNENLKSEIHTLLRIEVSNLRHEMFLVSVLHL